MLLRVINERLKVLLDTNDNPPELDALFRLRAALVWWVQGLLEPGDVSLRSYLPALVDQEVVTVLRESGFWQWGAIPLRVGRSRPAAAPPTPGRVPETPAPHE